MTDPWTSPADGLVESRNRVTAVTATGGPAWGARLLDDVESFLARFVVYPSDDARVAHALWIAHTWFMDAWDSTPRIAFLSPEPGSGKSRALEVTEPLVPRPVHAVNTTPAYLFRKVSDDAGPPTILYDEIDTVFGPKAKDNEEIRGMLNAGHRRGATSGRCVVRGKVVETEELPAYCAVALAGLDDLPDTIQSRSVIVRMRRRAPGEQIEPWRHRLNSPEGHDLGERLRTWADVSQALLAGAWPEMPPEVTDRDADVWEALLSVADLAGGDWPRRARCTAVTLVTDPRGRAPSYGVLLLRDLRSIFREAGTDRLPTETIIERLVKMDESPWGDMRGKELDARGLARRLTKYEVKPHPLRVADRVFKGYDAADLADPWQRYLDDDGEGDRTTLSIPAAPPESAVTSVTGQQGLDIGNRVTDVTDAREIAARPICEMCREPFAGVLGEPLCPSCDADVRAEAAS